uniref:Transmembrane 9 superfamily member n=2 Tax=Quercus lobata TaxID=97700 RepID=A0A7N2R863_QUELO
MARRETTSFLVLILVALPALVFAIQTLRTEPSRKEYKEGDYIPLFANTAYSDRGHLYACNNESMYILFIVTYGITSWFSGYKATSFHSGFTTRGWIECVIQTGALYPVPVILLVLAIAIRSLLTTTTFYFIISFFVAIRLLTWGGKFGQTSINESKITCSTIHFQSEIPDQAWYTRTPAQMFLGGLLPFSIIYSMMDDIYASLYSLKVCGAFSTMFTAFISVIALTVLMGIICTCYQLYKQDHQWWWRSVLRGGSLAIFMFAYGLYFYARASARISMNLLEFLGYNACIFYTVFLILGTIGFYASSIGFHYMRRVLKRRETKKLNSFSHVDSKRDST